MSIFGRDSVPENFCLSLNHIPLHTHGKKQRLESASEQLVTHSTHTHTHTHTLCMAHVILLTGIFNPVKRGTERERELGGKLITSERFQPLNNGPHWPNKGLKSIKVTTSGVHSHGVSAV